MTQIEKVQYAAKADSAGAFHLLSRFLFILFAAMVFLAPSGPALAQQSAETSASAHDAIKARAAENTMTQKATIRNQLTADCVDVKAAHNEPSVTADSQRKFEMD